MLTPHLEKLILSGKASYNTFVVGGANKYILNVRKDHFIIITDICYFDQINTAEGWFNISLAQMGNIPYFLNTQLKVFSKKTNNNFVFRNNFTVCPVGSGQTQTFILNTVGHTKLDTYLVHESDVSFTFSCAGPLEDPDEIGGRSQNESEIGYPPPYDYGIAGQPGAIAVNNIVAASILYNNPPILNAAGGNKYLNARLPEFGTLMTEQFTFPVNAFLQLRSVQDPMAYPICNISYVEIAGNITNIQTQ